MANCEKRYVIGLNEQANPVRHDDDWGAIVVTVAIIGGILVTINAFAPQTAAMAASIH